MPSSERSAIAAGVLGSHECEASTPAAGMRTCCSVLLAARARGPRQHLATYTLTLSHDPVAQAAGDGCTATCECETDPCRFTASPQVNLASVVAGLVPGATLTLAPGTYAGGGSCGWSIQAASTPGNGSVSVVHERPITIRGSGQSASDVLIDCQAMGAVVDGAINGPTHLRLENMHFKSAQRSGVGGSLLRAERGALIVIDNCRVTDCGSDGEGGAILLSNSDLEIRGSHFEVLRAEVNGGALALVNGARALLIDSTFKDCSAGNFGGAAFVLSGSSCVMDGAVFAFNEAGAKGGGVFAGDNSHLNVSATVFKNNTSIRGGAAMVQFGSSLRINRGSTFIGNENQAYGGIYLLADSFLEIDGSGGRIEFVENHGWVAVHINVYLRCHVIFRGDILFTGGWARDQGVYIWDAIVEIFKDSHAGTRFQNNWAQLSSAGLCVASPETVAVVEGIVSEDNNVRLGDEGYTRVAGEGGTGVWVWTMASLFLRNSIVRRNSVSPKSHPSSFLFHLSRLR